MTQGKALKSKQVGKISQVAPGHLGSLTINRDTDRGLSRARAKIHWGGAAAETPATGQIRHTPKAQVDMSGPDTLLLETRELKDICQLQSEPFPHTDKFREKLMSASYR